VSTTFLAVPQRWRTACVLVLTSAAAPAFAASSPLDAGELPALIAAHYSAAHHDSAGIPAPLLAAATTPAQVQEAPWIEQEVLASDGIEEDTFGAAVAIDGDEAVITAPQPGSSTAGIPAGPGRAYIFRKQDGSWVQTAILAADDGVAGDFFGYSAAIQGDTVLIGAHYATVNSNAKAGAAYVFRHAGGNWTQSQKLVASDGVSKAYFGASLALDGDNAFVGSYALPVNGHNAQGAVYAYSGAASGPLQLTQEITNANGAALDQFGMAVAAHDGTVMIGSPNTKVGNNATQGAVFLYENNGGNWTVAQEIVANDGASGDAFGTSVSYDGTHALFGVPVGNTYMGEAYAFALDSDGTWVQTQKILPPAASTDIFYAMTVALSGNYALLSYPGYQSGQGRVDMYSLGTDGSWNLDQSYQHVTGDPADIFPYYGQAVAISGNTFLVGAYTRKVADTLYQGAAYFYTRDVPQWTVGTHVIGPASLAVHGSVSPTSITVDQGDTATFTMTPDPGYVLTSVDISACGGQANGDGSWTTDPVYGDCDVTATFALSADDVIFQGDFDSDVKVVGDVNLDLPATILGASINWETGATCVGSNDAPCDNTYHFRPASSFPVLGRYALVFRYPTNDDFVVDDALRAYGIVGDTENGDDISQPLQSGDSVGPDNTFVFPVSTNGTAAWHTADGLDAYIGFRFLNSKTGRINYGYAHLVTSPPGTPGATPTGFPAMLVDYAYNQRGDAIVIP